MPKDVMQTLGLVFLAGVGISLLTGSVLPVLVTAAVVWSGYHVARGLYG